MTQEKMPVFAVKCLVSLSRNTLTGRVWTEYGGRSIRKWCTGSGEEVQGQGDGMAGWSRSGIEGGLRVVMLWRSGIGVVRWHHGIRCEGPLKTYRRRNAPLPCFFISLLYFSSMRPHQHLSLLFIFS